MQKQLHQTIEYNKSMKINFHIHQMPLHKQAHIYKYIILLTFHPICFGLFSSLDAALGLCSQRFSFLKLFLAKTSRRERRSRWGYSHNFCFLSQCAKGKKFSAKDKIQSRKKEPLSIPLVSSLPQLQSMERNIKTKE